ncbi:DUF2726 domain-containing protein [Tumidithrix helvetica PCC 7403]|uniref:DUF2726 domain-containing protein n=1 Tax=Tumidithrix helvetica TaxID=3457545 RepID=UPI003CB21050
MTITSLVSDNNSFLPQGQICLMELIEGVLQDYSQYRLFPEVSLARTVKGLVLESNLSWELKNFLRSCSSLDILISRHEAMHSIPIICVERQSPYHDLPERQEADRKKAAILKQAGLPLLYADEPSKGFVRFFSAEQPNQVRCEINVYRGIGRDNLRKFLLSFIER